MTDTTRPPVPPFTRETAIEKVRLAEDAWNTRDPQKVSLGYTVDSRWRNRSEFATGRDEIAAGGGAAEATQVDALDETAVAEHLDAVIEKAGGVDISFNAVGLRNTTLQGVPLVDLEVEDFMRPITEHVRANFLTARLAGRHMTAKGSGVIMTVTSIPSRIANPLMGGVAVAMAAEEALIRDLSVEFAPHGVRVAGVRTQGMPDSGTIEEVFGIHAKAHGVTREQFQYMVAERTHRKRLPTLQEMAEVVAFIAISARNSEPLLRRPQVVDCEK